VLKTWRPSQEAPMEEKRESGTADPMWDLEVDDNTADQLSSYIV